MEQDKNFKEFLKTLVEQNKAILVNQIVQNKTDKEFLKIQKQEYNVQTESVEKNLSQSKKLLEKIEKHLVKSGEVYKKTNDKIVGKLDNLGKLDKAPQSKLQADRDTRPLTFKERLQQKVASVKGIGGSIARGVGAIGRTVSSPIKSAQSLGSSVQDKIYSGIEQSVGFVGDVLGTKEGFDVKKQRYAQAQLASSKLATDQSRGTVTAKEDVLSFKEKEFAAIQKLTKKIEELEKVKQERKPYGAGLSEQEQSEYESLASRRSKIESRGSKSIDARYRSGPEKLEESDSQKEAEKSAEVKRQENPEADNIVSAQEKLSDTAKEDLNLTKELLDTTKESVTILKDIRQSLADQIQPLRTKEQPVALTQGTEVASGPGLGDLASSALDLGGDLLGRNKGKPGIPKPAGKPSLGGRIMGGIKSVGPGLLKGGATALGGMALGYGAEKLIESGHEKVGGAVDVGAEALSGAGMGAMIGSIIPGIGTGIGAAIGGVAGGAYGLYKNRGNLFGGDKKKDGGGELSTKYGKEAEKIAEEALKNGTDPSDLEAAILEKLQEKYKNENIEFLESAAFSAAMKANNKKDTKGSEQKSDQSKAGTYKTEAEKAGITNPAETAGAQGLTKQQADKIPEKDLFGGLTKEQYEFATQKVSGKYKNEMIDESGKEITDEKKRVAAMKKAVGQIQDLTKVAGKKDVTAKMDSSQVGAMQPAAVESPDPQLDRDIKENRARVSQAQKDGSLAVEPARRAPSELSDLSVQYNDNVREASQSSPTPAPIIMNNSSNNSTTKIMPMKADPRPSSRGSALDRHIDRVSTY